MKFIKQAFMGSIISSAFALSSPSVWAHEGPRPPFDTENMTFDLEVLPKKDSLRKTVTPIQKRLRENNLSDGKSELVALKTYPLTNLSPKKLEYAILGMAYEIYELFLDGIDSVEDADKMAFAKAARTVKHTIDFHSYSEADSRLIIRLMAESYNESRISRSYEYADNTLPVIKALGDEKDLWVAVRRGLVPRPGKSSKYVSQVTIFNRATSKLVAYFFVEGRL